MAGESKLWEFYLDLKTKGKEQVDKDIADVSDKLKKADVYASFAAQFDSFTNGAANALKAVSAAGAKVGESFAAARSKALEAADAPKGLLAIQDQLAKRLDIVKARYDAGKISAENFGTQAGNFSKLASDQAAKLGEQLGKQEAAAKKSAEGIRAMGLAFAVASVGIGGWVRSGLAGTTMGERLGLQFQLLSREVASLFIPVLESVIGVVQRVTDWFRSLSGEQQAAIGKWVTIGVAALGVATILPKVIGGLMGIGNMLKLLMANPIVALVAGIVMLATSTEEGRAALGGLFEAFAPVGAALAGLGQAFAPITEALGSVLPPLIRALTPLFEGIAWVITKIVQGITLVVEGVRSIVSTIGSALSSVFETVDGWTGGFLSRVGRGIGDLLSAGQSGATGRAVREGNNRHELANVSRGPEDFRASFTRFQVAAMRTQGGESVQERQLRETQRTNEILGGIRNAAGQPSPPAIA